MAKYLIRAKYGAEGTKGLLRDGGTGRRAAVTKAVEGIGGKVDEFYYALGDVEAYLIVDLPDTTAATALTLAVNASGVVAITAVPLLTCEEVDAAAHKTVSYRAPGQ
jgi:uncharacterized protein with GYD domain